MSRLIDADELKKQAYKSGDWDKPLVVDVADIDDAPTVNEWHYPSKGEYPTDDRRVLCKLKGVEDWYECGGYDRDNDEWSFECIDLPGDSILAWQYIEPPKDREWVL